MEVRTLTLRGDAVDSVADALVQERATESGRTINRLGVENVTRYAAGEFTLLAFEKASAYRDDWVMVAVLVEQVDERTANVAVLVGGGREGPYDILDIEQRLTRRGVGEEEYGESGRLGSVVGTIEEVCRELDVDVEAD